MPPPLPPDAGDSADPLGTRVLVPPEAVILDWKGIPPEPCSVKAGDWTRTKPSTGVAALLD